MEWSLFPPGSLDLLQEEEKGSVASNHQKTAPEEEEETDAEDRPDPLGEEDNGEERGEGRLEEEDHRRRERRETLQCLDEGEIGQAAHTDPQIEEGRQGFRFQEEIRGKEEGAACEEEEEKDPQQAEEKRDNVDLQGGGPLQGPLTQENVEGEREGGKEGEKIPPLRRETVGEEDDSNPHQTEKDSGPTTEVSGLSLKSSPDEEDEERVGTKDQGRLGGCPVEHGELKARHGKGGVQKPQKG